MMKSSITPLLLIAAFGASAHAAAVDYTQDFETTSGWSIPQEFLNPGGSLAHLIQTNGTTTPTGTSAPTGHSGTHGFFISGLNTNYDDNDNIVGTPSVTTESISLHGETSLRFAIDLATSTTNPQWNTTSVVDFQYQVDGMGWIDIFAATDSDGIGGSTPNINGIAITNTFSTFTANLTNLIGSSIELRVVWTNLGVGESLAVDNIYVSSVPLPPAAFAGLGLLAGMGAYRRIRR